MQLNEVLIRSSDRYCSNTQMTLEFVGLLKADDAFNEVQKVAQTESLALLTVATFFSAVTATTLGLSVDNHNNVYEAVNFFWFCSLVFSVASVMNSLLALSWKHSVL